MVVRLLLLFAALAAVWWVLRPRPKAPPRAAPPPAPSTAGGRSGTSNPTAALELEAMVDCAHCGLHLPASEALRDEAARAYCSPEHRRAGPPGGR
jgi:uncharacterized protein